MSGFESWWACHSNLMLNLTVPKIIALLLSWGYVLILPIAIVEGPIITIVVGFLVSLGHFNFFVAYLVLILADALGDLLYYGIGRWGHGPWVRKLIAYIGATHERMERLEKKFRRHDFKILMLNKTQAMGALVLYFCGSIRMPLGRFLWINILGSIPKIAFFEIVGFYFGKSYVRLQSYLDFAGIITFLIPVILLIIYWLSRCYSKKTECL